MPWWKAIESRPSNDERARRIEKKMRLRLDLFGIFGFLSFYKI